MKEIHPQLLPNSVALYCWSPIARCSLAMWWSTKGHPLPTAPHASQKVGSVAKEIQSPLPPCSVKVYRKKLNCPLLLSTEAV